VQLSAVALAEHTQAVYSYLFIGARGWAYGGTELNFVTLNAIYAAKTCALI
jgi:hypothetical protein